ncbi:VanZ family protein [Oscillospiraceae bacterium CM]|nr:VanZ family protein [Oscillospiraceae bacterium CM]
MKRIIIIELMAIYIIILLRITVFRHDFFRHRLFENGQVNLIVFKVYFEILMEKNYLFFIYLFVGNIVSFMPLGFLLPFIAKKDITLPFVVLTGGFVSLVIEVSQYVFGTGESELDDILLNTIGAVLGFLLYRLYQRYQNKRAE